MLSTEEKAKLLDALSTLVNAIGQVSIIRIDINLGKVQLSSVGSFNRLCNALHDLVDNGYVFTQLSAYTFELTQLSIKSPHSDLTVFDLNIPMVTKKALITTFGTIYKGRYRVNMSVQDLIKLTPLQISSAHNVGKVGIYKIIRALNDYGLTLAEY
jgi:hypothetical protein